MSARIYPVVLSGGSGKRLWPLSRGATPKQFLALTSDRSMFQETLLRLGFDHPTSQHRFAPPIVIANEGHADLVKDQLDAIATKPGAILLEPIGRNTAPAAAAAALWIKRTDPGGLILLLAADHYIADVPGFRAAIETAALAAEAGFIATFGIAPTSPETGYGYIEQGEPIAGHPGTFRVARFVEKPKLPEAEKYVASGHYAWNSGMFLFRSDTLLEEMNRYCPRIVEAVTRALPPSADKDGLVVLDRAQFGEAPSEAIDTAVMERTAKAAVVPARIGWSDVGSFAALWEAGAGDNSGNVTKGDVVLHGTSRSFVHAGSRCVAVIGAEDFVIVETPDAVLVAKRGKVQEIKALVDGLEKAGRHRLTSGPADDEIAVFELRPGMVKEIKPNLKYPAQLTVLKGEVKIIANGAKIALGETQSMRLPEGWQGSIEAPGDAAARCLLVVFRHQPDTNR
jgi:mannose-1-phosphate guanylyltransferase/mannose-6-phosphate isomerase